MFRMECIDAFRKVYESPRFDKSQNNDFCVGNAFMRSAWVTFLSRYVEWKNVENWDSLPSNEPRMFPRVSERMNPFPTQNVKLQQKKPACPAVEAEQADLNAEELGFLDCFGGALISAGTAADTDIGIDDVLVLTLGDSLDRALIGTGAALDAGIGNVKSHDVTSLWIYFFAPTGGRTFILAWI